MSLTITFEIVKCTYVRLYGNDKESLGWMMKHLDKL